MVYVDVPAITTCRYALFVTSEGDLKQKLADHERNFRQQELTYKPERDKSGKIKMTELSSDWDLKD